MLNLEREIQEKTRAAIDQNQKEYYLREQIKVLRDELGEGEDENEFENYAQSIRNLKLSEEHEKKLLKDETVAALLAHYNVKTAGVTE